MFLSVTLWVSWLPHTPASCTSFHTCHLDAEDARQDFSHVLQIPPWKSEKQSWSSLSDWQICVVARVAWRNEANRCMDRSPTQFWIMYVLVPLTPLPGNWGDTLISTSELGFTELVYICMFLVFSTPASISSDSVSNKSSGISSYVRLISIFPYLVYY